MGEPEGRGAAWTEERSVSEPPGLQAPRRASGEQSTSDVGIRIAGVAVALAALTGLVLLLVHPAWNPARIRPLPRVGAAFIAFAFAAWLLRGISARWSVALILLGGIALQVAAISAPTRQSDDMYRYIWDGRVQAAGIDPYAHVPAAPQLTGLRNEFLWPTGGHCVTRRIPPESTVPVVAGCTMINPPVAEAYFFGVYKLSPAGSGTTPMQAAAGACAILITVLLLCALRSMGRDFRTAAYWAWCPTVALEVGNNAHVDVLAVGLAAAALVILAKAGRLRRSVFGGGVVGLAIATKITPVLVVPAVLRRRWAAVGAALAGAVAVVYLPHVLAVGTKVLGYMPGYLQENGYSNGARFAIIGLAVSGRVAILTVVVLLAVARLAVLCFSGPGPSSRD